jgi:hypothetical protein
MEPIDIVIALPLPVGSALVVNDRRWVVLSVEPYTRRDGSASSLVEWGADCVECGLQFTQKTGGTMMPCTATKRCKEHRKPRVRS